MCVFFRNIQSRRWGFLMSEMWSWIFHNSESFSFMCPMPEELFLPCELKIRLPLVFKSTTYEVCVTVIPEMLFFWLMVSHMDSEDLSSPENRFSLKVRGIKCDCEVPWVWLHCGYESKWKSFYYITCFLSTETMGMGCFAQIFNYHYNYKQR